MFRNKVLRLAVVSVPLCFSALRLAAFEHALPETQGVSSEAVLSWINSVERDVDALHSFVLVRHGKIVAEGWWAPYRRESPHMLYSLSKSFTSTAVGIAVDEGRLSLDDRVVSFFPDKLPGQPCDNLKRMRVRDLLCMGTGNHDDTLPAIKEDVSGDWVRVFLSRPVEHEPGTHFRYNTGATYMLSAILGKVTNQDLVDYLQPRLFGPLGIIDPSWEKCPQGIHTGGYGLKVRTEDIAALGQLYLRKGMWADRRLLSEKWVAMASSKQIDNGSNPESDWNQGYGFQFWRCRHNAFRGDGAFGQYCVVMPEQDAVLAITSGLGNMQQVLDLVWTHLLPGMKEGALSENSQASGELAGKLRSLVLPVVKGEKSSVGGTAFTGRKYLFEENEKGLKSLEMVQRQDDVVLRLVNTHGLQEIRCGSGSWLPGEITFERELVLPVGTTNGRQGIAASGAWKEQDCYEACVYFSETPFRLTMTMTFADETVALDLKYNVMFGGKTSFNIRGKIHY